MNDGKFFIPNPVIAGKLKLPSAMLTGQQLELLLSRLFWNYLDVNDFSQFPIPFLCIATDLEEGKPVTFTEGYLPSVIRASMAMPTVFDPVKINGHIFVDGGVYDSFPVEVVKSKGVDIIIGVDVGFEPSRGDSLNNMLRIIKQTIFMHNVEKNNKQRSLCDVLIKLQIPDMHMMSFDKADSIVALGEAEARKQYQILKHLADSLRFIDSIIDKQYTQIIKGKQRKIDKIIIQGNTHISENFILSKLNLKVPCYVDSYDIEDGMNRLYGTLLFSKIDFQFNHDAVKMSIY